MRRRWPNVTLVNDLDRGTVTFIADGQKKASLDAYYDALTVTQKAEILAVAMDTSEPYIRSTIEHVPDAESKIVFNRFHVMKHMTEAVDTVHSEEHKGLRAQGDETLNCTRCLWLFSEDTLPVNYWFPGCYQARLPQETPLFPHQIVLGSLSTRRSVETGTSN